MNKINGVIKKERICIGGLDQTTIDCRRIVKHALEINAKSIILFHNHPSGNPTPSTNDAKQTNKLKNMLDVFDINLIDHIIISASNCFTFAENKAFNVTPTSLDD